ncbi:hypothetical protein RJ640_003729 [Escallonia rubra]|uniref:Fe2OG dioxygenase domain-containing protein n=1 Tax=Escallonia rubra TaxID=112253 RepID=A0AA88S4M3_9ASTE|nr:hypothetical protein RJ640_003729 [Escallonia rubra]
MVTSTIPTIDLSPFVTDGDEDGKKKAMEIISLACSEYGFFQVVNHGVPLSLMSRAMELSKIFFAYPTEEKLKSVPKSGAPLPAGYNDWDARKEDVFICTPGTSFNVFPSNPPEFQKVMEELFGYFIKAGQLVESIINDCLGLPPNVLKGYNHDRSEDHMQAYHYFPATGTDNIGAAEHQDANCVTFVFQDDVGGLEVRKDSEWIRVNPAKGALVVNVGDVIQVLSNNRFKSGLHRVVRTEGKSRYSFPFFYSINRDKWIEPLSQLTREIGEPAKYRGFTHRDYGVLRMRQRTNPSRPEEKFDITHYAILT